MIGLIALYLAVQQVREYQVIDLNERNRLSAQARTIENNIVRQLEATSSALLSVLNDWPFLMSLPDGEALVNRRLQSLSDSMPGVRTLLVLDDQGRTLNSNRAELVGRSFSTRAYVTAVQQRPNPDTLYVSPPFKTVLDVYALNLTRASVDPDGQLTIIASATLDPDFFGVLMESVLYSPDMWTGMAHGDGEIFNVAPALEGALGIDLNRPGSLFRLHQESGEAKTLLEGVVATTGHLSLMAQRTLLPDHLSMDKPLVIAVTRSRAGIFADWWEETFVLVVLWGILVLVSVVGMWIYQRRQHHLIELLDQQESFRRRAEEEVRKLAFYDALTELPNRRLLLDRMKQMQAAGIRHERCSALLFVDLDHFKSLNDQFGHEEGDAFLQRVAKQMLACVRDEDTVARLGGDEFVVMLSELSRDRAEAAWQARVVGEKILQVFRQDAMFTKLNPPCSASIGVTLFGVGAESVEDIVKRADKAMYRVKAAGRDGVQLFEMPEAETVQPDAFPVGSASPNEV